MLDITPRAGDQLRRMRDEKGFEPGAVVRIVRGPGGFSWRFATSPEPADERVSAGDPEIYAAGVALPVLEGDVLDAQEGDDIHGELVLRGHS